MKLAPLSLAAILLYAGPALATSDVFLQWDDCPPAGAHVRTFACNSNSGAEVLIGSFVTSQPAPEVNSLESTIDVIFPVDVAPSWWNVGGCRASGSIQLSTDFSSGPSTCVNPWPAGSAGGAIWDLPPGSIRRGRIRVFQALPSTSAFPIVPDVHYYAFKLLLSHAKSTGTGVCPGCELPVGLLLSRLRVVGLNGLSEQVLSVSFDTREQSTHFADWQCDGTPHWAWDQNTLDDYTYGSSCTVPARRDTWGSVKSLYR